MKKILFSLLLTCLSLSLEAKQKKPPALNLLEQSIHREKLTAAIAVYSEEPSWMLGRIAQDFSGFEKECFSEKNILDFFQKNPSKKKENTLVRIKNNQLQIQSEAYPGNPPKDSRESVVIQAIQYLAQTIFLKDVTFIFSSGDIYEESEAPILCFTKKRDTLGVLIPDVQALGAYSLSEKGSLTKRIQAASDRLPWKKKEPLLFWRGATTGGRYTLGNWETFPRSQLVLASLERPDLINARFSLLVQNEPGLSQVFQNRGLMGDHVPEWASLHYKYLIDIDGNSCTYPRNYWILLSNSVLFKHDSPNIEWYYDLLEPWVHMIPVAEDFSDLVEHIEWAKTHDPEAKKIAERGSKLAREQLYPEASLAYLYLVIREFYNRQSL